MVRVSVLEVLGRGNWKVSGTYCVGVGGSDERGGDVCDAELGESGVQSRKDERGEIEKQSTGVAGD